MNFITLHLVSDELLYCSCGRVTNSNAYLIRYEENIRQTAVVRCIKCLRKEMSGELDRVFGKEK